MQAAQQPVAAGVLVALVERDDHLGVAPDAVPDTLARRRQAAEVVAPETPVDAGPEVQGHRLGHGGERLGGRRRRHRVEAFAAARLAGQPIEPGLRHLAAVAEDPLLLLSRPDHELTLEVLRAQQLPVDLEALRLLLERLLVGGDRLADRPWHGLGPLVPFGAAAPGGVAAGDGVGRVLRAMCRERPGERQRQRRGEQRGGGPRRAPARAASGPRPRTRAAAAAAVVRRQTAATLRGGAAAVDRVDRVDRVGAAAAGSRHESCLRWR